MHHDPVPEPTHPAALRTLAIALSLERDPEAFETAAARAGLAVHALERDARAALELSRVLDLVWRAPGGFLAGLVHLGAPVRLASATPEWFADLPEDVTGRRLQLLPAHEAVAHLRARPAVVKLADDKHPGLAASWFADGEQLRARLELARIPPDTPLLLADKWVVLDSE